jgi:hypothetical protein
MILAQLVATIGFVLPTAIWTCLRRSRGALAEGRFAVELALGVAVDLLSVLLLAHVCTLETATLISRGAWGVVGGAAVVRWWRAGGRLERPSPEQLRSLGMLALVVGGAVWLSMSLSRPCSIWDREWHIPLVSALRGQRLPFQNVYLPAQPLFYHFAGDAQAAMLQALSGGRLHAALALSLLHDIMFALVALNVVCFFRGLGMRRTPLAALVFFATVMLGPVTLLRDDVRKLESGFALVNYLTLSYRPHVALAYLFELGFLELGLGALLADASASIPSWRERLGGLALLSAALVLTDESSLGLLGLGLGALWLAFPDVLGPSRRAGALGLVALVAAIVASVVIFGGSIGPSAPHYNLSLVAPRAPGYASAAVPLSTFEGSSLMAQDLLPILGVLAALGAIALRTRDRVTLGAAMFFVTLAAASILALTCVDFEGQPSENHRFATGMFVAAPFVAALVLQQRARAIPLGAVVGGFAALTLFVTIGLGVASTIEWLGAGVAYRQCAHPGFYGWSAERFYDVDCRSETGSVLGERTAPIYADLMGFYLWTGCHPSFAAAPTQVRHKIKSTTPFYGPPAFEQLRASLPVPTDRLEVVCLTVAAAGPNQDPACARAAKLGPCEGRGDDFRVCSLDGPARAALVGKN